MFKKVRQDVDQETKSFQIPWESSSLTGDFAFNPQSQPEPPVVTKPNLTPPPPKPSNTTPNPTQVTKPNPTPPPPKPSNTTPNPTQVTKPNPIPQEEAKVQPDNPFLTPPPAANPTPSLNVKIPANRFSRSNPFDPETEEYLIPANPFSASNLFDSETTQVFMSMFSRAGLTLYEQRDIDRAIDVWDNALRIDSKQAEPLLAKAVALYTQGKTAEALKLAETALSIDIRFAELEYLNEHGWGARRLSDAKTFLEVPEIKSLIASLKSSQK